ncbi:MAG: glycosyltransferase family A protein [Pyrinomonadaceae bacterium]
MKKGLVSVVIPNYNYAHYLRETIDSVLAQTYPDVEIVVVDDGSKDDSKEILAGYGGKIRTIFQQNQGVSAARNNGVAVSEGEFVAFLDADDAWLPTKIEKQVARFREDEELGLVHVGVDEIDAEGNSLVHRLEGVEGKVCTALLMLKREGVLGGGSGMMVRRSVFDETGGFDLGLSTSADWDLHYRVSERYTVGFVPELLLKYRVHSSNMHANVGVMEHDMMLAFEKAFRTNEAEILAVRRAAYGSLHQILAGSYFVAGNYPAFISNSVKSLYFDPSNISYYLKFGRRPSNRRGVKVGA